MDVDCIIVCPGPSARLFRPDDWGNLCVCAVNRASVLLDEIGARYDWYCAMDGVALHYFQPRPTRGVIQHMKMLEQFKEKWIGWRDDLDVYDPDAARWSDYRDFASWSGTCAVACMIRMGYNNILAYGMDWTAPDWDGQPGFGRTDRRWEIERSIINQVLAGNRQASFRRIRA
jgi:hypothetical protein